MALVSASLCCLNLRRRFGAAPTRIRDRVAASANSLGGSGNQKDIAPQVMQWATNGAFGSQTFGISLGTSGCTNNGVIISEHKTSVFAALNFENLSQDMAKDDGEHLSSLAELMNIPRRIGRSSVLSRSCSTTT
jgi:Protein of unknown function (DUF3015)